MEYLNALKTIFLLWPIKDILKASVLTDFYKSEGNPYMRIDPLAVGKMS